MYLCKPSFLRFFCFLWHLLIILANNIPNHYYPTFDSITVSCGSTGNSTALDGRVWAGDSGPSLLQISGKSTKSRAIHQLALRDSTPYTNARVSRQEFSYIFQVKAGQKLIRLHFHQASYRGYKNSKALFTVKAGSYTLLSNFNTALYARVSGGQIFSREFCLNVEEDKQLIIKFIPSPKTSESDDNYAFINGIEIVNMPNGLYFTHDGDTGTHVVGQKYRFYIDNTTALETIHRLNIGGDSISPVEDTGMFRRWDEDSNYLLETGARSMRKIILIKYGDIPSYVAPSKVYQTTRSMLSPDKNLSPNRITWSFPVDCGFRYLIRLHFCELEHMVRGSGYKEFAVLINNQIADMIKWGGAYGVAVHKDYVFMMEGDRAASKRNLTITLQQKRGTDGNQIHGILNGLEVFKLSNPDNNLASIYEVYNSVSVIPQKKKPLCYGGRNVIATALTVIITLLNVFVYHLRVLSDSKSGSSNISSASTENLSRQFSLDELRSTTNNFDPGFLIGRGGYGKVYKGSIDRGRTVVAIKRMKPEARQGESQFWTEIKMLSKIRHDHLVSLVGYCKEGEERLLIFEYMTHGTLSDHLYKINRKGKCNPPLPWELRLKVSIGAARGLYYLHSRHRVIHRDVKSSNILLDKDWTAKISDFGLSKMGPVNESFTHISTNVKGTFGYLDPEYFLTRKITRKSDVYAFGVVLFEVLSGRPAVDIRLVEEQHSLASWARYCIREGKIDRIIDQNVKEQISPACLKVFVGIAGRCLQTKPQGRPAMADVVTSLELALVLQQTKGSMEQMEEENVSRSYSDQSDGAISFNELNISPPKGETEGTLTKELPSSAPKGSDKQPKRKKDDNANSSLAPKRLFGIFPRSTSKRKSSLLPPEGILRPFTSQEIQKATNNFNTSHVIGFRGSENVYKGYIDGGQTVVAIRLSSARESRLSMMRELQTAKEIQKQQHSLSEAHTVSLIGYCDSDFDMILVYDYMPNGTLYDHLHESHIEPLPWTRRLQICISAARGLCNLHSIIKQTILHRNLRSTNIWLDENWVPKVSEWGLSRKKGNNDLPKIAKVNWAHLDSDYIRPEDLTEKSYVFSFGLVLFEVLCPDKESDRWLDQDQVSLAQWVKTCLRNNFSGCIDPYLVGRIAPECFRIYTDTAARCLLDCGMERPSMSDLVEALENALRAQSAADGYQVT